MLKSLIRNVLLLCALFASSQVFAQNCASLGCVGRSVVILEGILVTASRWVPDSGGFLVGSVTFFGPYGPGNHPGMTQEDYSYYMVRNNNGKLKGLVDKYQLPCRKAGESDESYAPRAVASCTAESSAIALREQWILRTFAAAATTTYIAGLCVPHVSVQMSSNNYATCPAP
jgi:hypothetical protein